MQDHATRMDGMSAMINKGTQQQKQEVPQIDMAGLRKWGDELMLLRTKVGTMEDKMAMVEIGCNELQMSADTKFVHHGDLNQVSQTLSDVLERMDSLDPEVQQTQAQMRTLGTPPSNSEQRSRNEP